MNARTPALAKRLREYRDAYARFDAGHNCRHVDAVIRNAIELAQAHAPELELLAEIAATCHDIGLTPVEDDTVDVRLTHAQVGAAIVARDPVFLVELSPDALVDVVNAVRRHRASSGRAKTMLDMIVADADSRPISTSHAYLRAFAYGVVHHPDLSLRHQLMRAARQIKDRYADGKIYGREPHFPETAIAIKRVLQPIITAAFNYDYPALRAMLDIEGYPYDATAA